MKGLRKIHGVLAVVAGLALILGSVAVASNMGFKFVPDIGDGAAFNLSLPWNNNYTTAESLRSDLATYGAVDRVAEFSEASSLVSWDGFGGSNFAIAKGEAYVVYGGTGGLQPVVVGSHDPNFTLDFPAGGAFNASAPYHQTLSTAEELRRDIDAFAPGSIDRIAQFTTGSSLVSWDGFGGSNFALELGAGVVVYANTAVSGYSWPHY